MSTQPHTQTKQAVESRLRQQAAQDPTFRQHLLNDPKAAIASFLGVALPPGMNITVLEETPGQHYLVLPPAPPSLDALPLDDLELALVGGGRTMRPMGINECEEPGCPHGDPVVANRSRRASAC